MTTTIYIQDINTMAKDPAFLFYPGDYVTGTMYLDFECKGAYIDLLMLQFQKDHMTLHMIKHVLGHKYEDIWPHIKDKFVEKDGFFWNERLRKEKEIRIKYSKSRSDNRNSSKDMSNHMSNHMTQHMEDIDTNLSINTISINKIEFDKFWILYDKKVGKRDKIKKKWDALPANTQSEIIEHIPKYKLSQPDKKFRKHPETYLNNESWNDEIIPSGKILSIQPGITTLPPKGFDYKQSK